MHTARGDCPVEDIEVSAEMVRAVVAGVAKFSTDTRDSAEAVLRDCGLATPESGEWYPLGRYLDAIDALYDVVGDHGVHALGQRVRRTVSFPPVEGVPAALSALDDVYRDQHRGGDVGGYSFRQIGDDDGRIECHTPNRCAFDRGVVEGVAVGYAERFVRVSEIGVCRADGADRCTYEISW